MCVVSMVTQHWHERFPYPNQMTYIDWQTLQELRRKAAIYDKEHGQEDCPDPVKQKWFEDAYKHFMEKHAGKLSYSLDVKDSAGVLRYSSLIKE